MESEKLLTWVSQKKKQKIRCLKEEGNKRKTGERNRRAMWNKEQSVHKIMKKKKKECKLNLRCKIQFRISTFSFSEVNQGAIES